MKKICFVFIAFIVVNMSVFGEESKLAADKLDLKNQLLQNEIVKGQAEKDKEGAYAHIEETYLPGVYDQETAKKIIEDDQRKITDADKAIGLAESEIQRLEAEIAEIDKIIPGGALDIASVDENLKSKLAYLEAQNKALQKAKDNIGKLEDAGRELARQRDSTKRRIDDIAGRLSQLVCAPARDAEVAKRAEENNLQNKDGEIKINSDAKNKALEEEKKIEGVIKQTDVEVQQLSIVIEAQKKKSALEERKGQKSRDKTKNEENKQASKKELELAKNTLDLLTQEYTVEENGAKIERDLLKASKGSSLDLDKKKIEL